MSPDPDQEGQALVVVVGLLALAAVVIVGLREADERLLGHLQAQRAAEAAAEAAGVVVADRLADLAEEARGQHKEIDGPALAVGDDTLRQRAEVAAREVLAPLGATLDALRFELRSDEVSVRVEVRRAGSGAVARVGVRAP